MPRDNLAAIVALLFSGGGAAAWSPLDLGAVLKAWYNSADASTLWQDSARTIPAGVGDPVGSWDDKSANGWHQQQTTTANKPTRTADGLDWDTTNDYLSNVSVAANKPTYFAWVGKIKTTGTNEYFFDGLAAEHYVRGDLANTKFRIRAGTGTILSASAWDTNFHLFEAIFDDPASSINVDGGTAGSGNVGTNALSAGLVLGNAMALNVPSGIILKEKVIAENPTAEQQTLIRDYLNSQWSVY